MRTTTVPIHLAGTVTLKSGDWRTGDLVFDLDEEWSWEMLDGSSGEIEYTIPFALVASIEPAGRDGSLVRLVNGLSLELEDSHDVDHDNSGVVVIPQGQGRTRARQVDGNQQDRVQLKAFPVFRPAGWSVRFGFGIESTCCEFTVPTGLIGVAVVNDDLRWDLQARR